MKSLIQAQKKSLTLRVNTDLLTEVIRMGFLSAISHRDEVSKGKATMTESQALDATIINIKQLLNN